MSRTKRNTSVAKPTPTPDKYSSIPTLQEFKNSRRDLSKEQIEYVATQIKNSTLETVYLPLDQLSATAEQYLTLADVLTEKGYFVTTIHGTNEVVGISVRLKPYHI